MLATFSDVTPRDDLESGSGADALRDTYGRGVPIPVARDEAVREAIAAHFAASAAGPSRFPRLGIPLAAAAALLIAATAWLAWPGPAPAPTIAGDIDRDGVRDVVDALALALRLDAGEAGKEPDAHADVNGDGRVDESDVRWIAQRAVALEGGA